jgi:hypothetical protein
MKVYMLQNKDGLFYERRSGRWVPQERGAIWPSKAGPRSAKGHSDQDAKTVEFELVEVE